MSAVLSRLDSHLELSEWWAGQRSTSLADAFWQTSWLLIAAIVAADVLDLVFPAAGAAGTVLWYVSYIYVIVFAILALRDVIRSSISAAAPFAPFVVALYVAITMVNVGWPHTFSSETALEIACAAHRLDSGGDLGFHSPCLFGYPMRQFLLQALPTVAFGPSVFNLVMLGGTYFVCGVAIFAGGAIRLFRSKYMGNLIAALLLSVFLQLYFWNHFYVIFEQSIFPLSLALILGGLALYFRSGDERRALPLIGIVLLWLIAAYTPSLAVFGLGLAGLAYLALTRPELRLPCLLLIGLTALSACISTTYRMDIGVSSSGGMWDRLWPTLEHVVYQNQGVPWSTPFVVFPLIVTVALALTGIIGRLALAVGLWVVVVFVFAVTSRGYAVYGIDFQLHRALIIAPVLITMGAFLLARRRLKGWRNALEVTLLLSVLIGVKYHVDYMQSLPASTGLGLDLWFQQHLSVIRSHTKPVTMTWWPGSNADVPGATDTLAYLAPNVTVSYLLPQQIGKGCSGLAELKGVIVAQAGAPCTAALQLKVASGVIHYVGTFPTTTMRLLVYTA